MKILPHEKSTPANNIHVTTSAMKILPSKNLVGLDPQKNFPSKISSYTVVRQQADGSAALNPFALHAIHTVESVPVPIF